MITPSPPDTPPDQPVLPDQPLSTGSLCLDLSLGSGGILPGDIVQISGPIASGKTVLCQHLVASAGSSGRVCAWIDADFTLDPAFARRCGIDPAGLLVVQPSDTRAALDILVRLANTGDVAIIVVDSLNSLITPDELLPTGPNPDEDLLSIALGCVSSSRQRNGVVLVFTRLELPARGATYHNLHARLSRLDE